MTLGMRLKEVRTDLGMKQSEFAESLGTSLSAYSKYEPGRVQPTLTLIKLVCLKYNVNEKWLLVGEGRKYKSSEIDDKLMKSVHELTKNDTELNQQFMLNFSILSEENKTMIIHLLKQLKKET